MWFVVKGWLASDDPAVLDHALHADNTGRRTSAAGRHRSRTQADGVILRSDTRLWIYGHAPRRHHGRRARQRGPQRGSAGFGHAASRWIEHAGGWHFHSRAMADSRRTLIAAVGQQFAAGRELFQNSAAHSRGTGRASLSIESRDTVCPVAG